MTTPSAGKWAWPVGCALVCLGLGTASGLSTVGGSDSWYQTLSKPPGTPPPWIFGPVWSVLYLMMGIAVGRLIQRRAMRVVAVFVTQFVLNLLWTPVFFGAHQIGVALAILGAIWAGVVTTLLMARRTDQLSTWLLLPYLLWVTYASYLNAGIFWLNR